MRPTCFCATPAEPPPRGGDRDRGTSLEPRLGGDRRQQRSPTTMDSHGFLAVSFPVVGDRNPLRGCDRGVQVYFGTSVRAPEPTPPGNALSRAQFLADAGHAAVPIRARCQVRAVRIFQDEVLLICGGEIVRSSRSGPGRRTHSRTGGVVVANFTLRTPAERLHWISSPTTPWVLVSWL